MIVEPVVIQKLDTRATLLVLQEDVGVKGICTTLQLVEVQLGQTVTVTPDIATPEQLSMAEHLRQMGRDEVTSWEDRKMESFKPMSDPLF